VKLNCSPAVALHYKPGFETLILKGFPVFNYNVRHFKPGLLYVNPAQSDDRT
jgi:hypothetical protein